MKTSIELIPISHIKPYWRNPRNNDEAVDAVAESIKEFGMNNPILLDTDMTIINGHTRFKACQRLDMEEIPCIIADHLTDEQIHAYRIVDNKTSEKATWNQADLMAEIRAAPGLLKFQTFFPELMIKPVSLDTSLKPVTEQMVQNSQNQLNTLGGQKGSRVQKIMCPHCGDTFEVI